MTKRSRPYETLENQEPKRSKTSHGADEQQDVEVMLLNRCAITEDSTQSNDSLQLSTTQLSSSIVPQQQESSNSTGTQTEEYTSPTQHRNPSKRNQENPRTRPPFVQVLETQTLTTAWLGVPKQHSNSNIFTYPRFKLSRQQTRPVLPTLLLETKLKQGEERKKPQKGLKIFEDETAACDNITELEDRNFEVAMEDAHYDVESWIQELGMNYAIVVISFITPFADRLDTAA
jgi:hypothetical protein